MTRLRTMTRKTDWGWEGAVLLDNAVVFTTGHEPTEHYALKLATQWMHNLIVDLRESTVTCEVHL